MLEDVPQLDTLIVPVGGGGLISGVAIAAKGDQSRYSRSLARRAALYPAMCQAMNGDPPTEEPPAQTIAEGIAVKQPGYAHQRHLQGIWSPTSSLVGEEAMEHALIMMLEIEKTMVEGAAAAGLAALLSTRGAEFKGRKVGIVMSGGNIDMRMLSNVILRELAREGRILTLDVAIDDRPGAAGAVARWSPSAGGNMLEVSHNRMMSGHSAKSATLGMVIEARDTGACTG